MQVRLCQPVRIIRRVVEPAVRHIEWVEYQLTQQRLPAPTSAESLDHVTCQRVDDVVIVRLRAEVSRRVHVFDDPAPATTKYKHR